MTPGEAYEAFLVPSVFRPWAETVLKRDPPAAAARVVDVACGTGIAARLAAGFVGPAGAVVGLDMDDGMLSVARAAGEASIAWLQGNAMAIPFGSEAFDYVVCLEGIQFFPDRAAGLREMRRILRPGGRLVASIWGPLAANPGYAALADGLRTFVSEDAARLPPFALTDADEIRRLVASAGFTHARVSTAELALTVPSGEAFVDWVAAGGPTIRRNLARIPELRRAEFGRLVNDRLDRYRTPQGLTLPSRRNVVSASRSAG